MIGAVFIAEFPIASTNGVTVFTTEDPLSVEGFSLFGDVLCLGLLGLVVERRLFTFSRLRLPGRYGMSFASAIGSIISR